MTTPTPDEHAPPTEAPATGESRAAADAAERQAAADTQATLTDLADSVALLPQAPHVEGEEERPDGAVALPVIEQDGNRYVPAFTSEDALVAAGGDPDTALGISVVELAENWPEDDLWLAVNPSTDEGLALPSDLVRALPSFSHAGRSGRTGGERDT
ncbi:SseB family protein [Streptomyces sp. NPDC006923]|uniref:SseB family protein n=1 Tax=Streptomyces sp. NPDC006923 TaxID=3155355 RepID=UPI0033D45A11